MPRSAGLWGAIGRDKAGYDDGGNPHERSDTPELYPETQTPDIASLIRATLAEGCHGNRQFDRAEMW